MASEWLPPASTAVAAELATDTVRVVEPVIKLNVALIVVEPVDTPDASPKGLINATDASVDDHAATSEMSCVAAFERVALAVNCWVSSSAIVGFSGAIEMEDMSATVSVEDAGMPSYVAVIVEAPVESASTEPTPVITATASSEEAHAAYLVTS